MEIFVEFDFSGKLFRFKIKARKKRNLKYFQVKNAKEHQQKIENDIIARTNEAEDSQFHWWSEFLSNVSKNARSEQQMMDRIHNELRNYPNPAIEKYSN